MCNPLSPSHAGETGLSPIFELLEGLNTLDIEGKVIIFWSEKITEGGVEDGIGKMGTFSGSVGHSRKDEPSL